MCLMIDGLPVGPWPVGATRREALIGEGEEGANSLFKIVENFACIWFLRGVSSVIVGTKVKLVLR